MKKNKGFTLIELLAVIVILAIIALIATPLILNIINRARKQAFQRSAEGVLKAGKNYYLLQQLEPQGFNKVTFHCENDKCLSEDNKELEVEGNVGTGDVTIDKQGNVALKLSNGSYCTYKYASKNNVEIKEGECSDIEVTSTVLPKTGETFQAIVYLDPVNLNKVCDEKAYEENLNKYYETNQKVATRYDGTEVPNPTGLKTGCMKWYVYNDNSDGTVDMILDHNTYVGGYSNSLQALKNLKNEWKDSIGKDNIRMMSGTDIVNMTGTTGWNITDKSTWFYFDSKNQNFVVNGSNRSKYHWLFDYSDHCLDWGGCHYNYSNGNSYLGYWTSDFVNDDYLWTVTRSGRIYAEEIGNVGYGLRPVITISKSQINL